MRCSWILLLCIPFFTCGAQPPVYTIETYAGTLSNGDGRAATSAVLVQPQSVAADRAGNIYFADSGDHRVRRISPAGIIDTVAGTGSPGLKGDGGPALKAQLNAPYGIAVDLAGNLYIADLGNSCVRRVGADGVIQTVAGNGTELIRGTGGIAATQAKLSQPRDVAVDRAGNLFIADFGAHRVYQVSPEGMLTVVAGTGEAGTIRQNTPAALAPLSAPAALAIDSTGALYIGDSGNRRVRRLLAGQLITLLDRTGKELEFAAPTGIAVDQWNRVHVADGGSRVTVVSQTGEFISIGIGGVAVAVNTNGEVFTASERQILKLSGLTVTAMAGGGKGPTAGDGPNPDEWRFHSPSAIARDIGGHLFIADTGQGRIRRISYDGVLSTCTTRIQSPVALAFDSKWRLHAADRATGGVYRVEASGAVQLVWRSEGRYVNPAAIAFDASDNLFIADSYNHVIRKLTPEGAMTVLAGGGPTDSDGLALLSKLNAPASLAFDKAGALWFAEAGSGRIRKFSGGRLTSLPGIQLKEPKGLRIDAEGQIVVAESGGNRILRLTGAGEWLPLAGTGDRGFSGDGDLALGASLNAPSDVLPEADGTLLIVDNGNHRLRRLRPASTFEPADEDRTPPPGQVVSSVSVTHAATAAVQALAPGQLAYLTGDKLTANCKVSFGNASASVQAASDGRLTVRVPDSLNAGPFEVVAAAGSAVCGKGKAEIARRSPGIFTTEGNSRLAVALNEDNTPNGVLTPAARGSVITLYVTGEGVAPGAVTADIGGYSSEVTWWGPAPGFAGVLQVNIRTPGGFSPSGMVNIALSVDGVPAQSGVMIVSR